MNKESKSKILWAGGILIVLFLFVFNQKGHKPFQSVSNLAIKPFARVVSGTGYWVNQKFYFISQIGNLKKENDELLNENLKLKFEVSQLKEAENENKILREEINLVSRTEFDTEASLVLGHSLSTNRKIIFLDKGSKNGIEENMPLIVGGGVLVGRISKVFETTSEAELLLDQSNKINAEIQENQVKGIIQGEFGTSIVMSMIPQSAEIEKGQTIITSGLGGSFPRGLLIGYIKEKETMADQLFQKVSIEVPVQVRDLRLVWVIKGRLEK